MTERRDKHDLLELFAKLEHCFSDELFAGLVAQVATIMVVPNKNNFQQLVVAHRLYPNTFCMVVEGLELPKTLVGLLELYLQMRRTGQANQELHRVLMGARESALRDDDWDILEQYAARGLTNEFAAREQRR